MLHIGNLTAQYGTNPLGVGAERPGLGWVLGGETNSFGEVQSAYRILVDTSPERLERDEGSEWDSGRVVSSESQHVVYGGAALRPRCRYYWKVKVWDGDGGESDWSEPGWWETGLLETDEWHASWITAPFLPDPQPEPDLLRGVPVVWDPQEGWASADGRAIRFFRLNFAIGQDVSAVRAVLHLFAVDSVYVYVNGRYEGLYFPYEQAVALDVSELLREGGNAIACSSDGEKPGFVAALSVETGDGGRTVYPTGTDWKMCREREPGWNGTEHDDVGWLEPAPIGLFGEGEWKSYKRILYPVNKGYGVHPKFRKTFRVRPGLRQARLYVSALGVYRFKVNGAAATNDAFAPGWTDYRIRIPYQTYDLTDNLRPGANDLEATVGSGWYAGLLSICGPYHYGSKVAFRAQLHLRYEDGTEETIVTGEDWDTAESPVRAADMFMGELYDARLENAAQSAQPASVSVEPPGGAMTAAVGPPIRPTRELKPASIVRNGPDSYLVDMGQNMVGWLRLAASGGAGTRITLRYAERLDAEGRLYTLNLRSAKQTDCYIMKGEAEEVYEPLFTFHGFQYVQIDGYPGELTADRATGIVVHSAAEEVGEMRTSHPLINRLLDNIRWSQRGNFFGIPLDCPQRDERLGWTGDAHAFARTAAYNMNCAAFYEKWLTDVRDAQREDGAYPNVAPDVVHLGAGFVFFGDGGVITPWTMYKMYGDKRFITANYAAMRKWIAFMRRDCDERLIRRTETFGDHLSYGAETPKGVINAAFFAYSVKLMREMAEAVGELEDEREYAELFARLKEVFLAHYVREDGTIEGHTQTAYVLALMIGLLPERLIAGAAARLADDIRRNDFHITTGFMGVSYVLAVLTEHGHTETAFRLLLQETFPSWLYPVRKGATTIWERWDGWNEEKGFQDPEMNSFNHYALGSVGEWLYRYLGGIDQAPGTVGFREPLIHPCPGGGFTEVRSRYRSSYGWIGSGWTLDGEHFTLLAEVPVNTTALIAVPADEGAPVLVNGSLMDGLACEGLPRGCKVLRRDSTRVWLQAGSGRYEFKSKIKERGRNERTANASGMDLVSG